MQKHRCAMNKFQYLVIIQIGIIAGTCLALAFFVFKTETTFIPLGIAFLVIVETIVLFNFIDTLNKKLSNFLDAIRHNDFSSKVEIKQLGKSFRDLEHKFNQVLDDFQKTKLQNEQNLQFLQTIFQHIGVGLIAFDENGTVAAKNSAFSKLTNTHSIASIEQLSTFDDHFAQLLMEIKPNSKDLFKTQIEDSYIQLSVYATAFQVNNTWMKLISIQNIQTELDDKELDTWQKLIRVLTHEIMNSIAPITSLSSTLLSLFPSEGKTSIDKETASDIKSALNSIHKRSKHLSAFVDKYRQMAKIPQLEMSRFPISEIFNSVTELFAQACNEKGIKLTASAVPDSIEVVADRCLLEQVIINLLKNSIQATESTQNAEISISAGYNRLSKIEIQVADNGMGIIPEVLEKIFIPFYTTKPDGSGIGLSLSRQIIKKHGGNLQVYSKKEGLTKAIITL